MFDQGPLHQNSPPAESARRDKLQTPLFDIDRSTQQKIQTVSLLVLAVLGSIYLIYWLRPVLVPFVVALFVVSGLSPILAVLERTLGVTRIVAAAITFLSGVALLIMFGMAISISMTDLTKNGGRYIDRIEAIAQQIDQHTFLDLNFRRQQNGEIVPVADPQNVPDQVLSPVDVLPVTPDDADQASEETDALSSDGQGVASSGDLIDQTETPTAMTDGAGMDAADIPPVNPGGPQKLVETLARQGIAIVSQSLFSLVSTSVVVLIFVFFLLLGTPVLVSSNETIQEINHQVRVYLGLKTIISIFTGLAFGLALRLFGVPMAFTFGVLAFLLNFVPNVGPIVASLLPIPLIIFDPSGNLAWMLSAIGVTSMIQVASGNLVEPKLMGESSDLHPVVVLLSLMFWGMMWGIIGMFLATPIAAGFKIVLERFDETKPLAAFMAGRSARPPRPETEALIKPDSSPAGPASSS
ncbi:membrane protein- a permease [Rhodopirellula maiorica SM1]|uniref:Membrane protein-a permease n=1 Tax=Rhodopirellula maiorica SM1 TaxID=1265738 RepID=M5RKF1_9BACT|nr:AI-2E family transporter [Rhodopirellula maiorica]EMI19780.1 membrane protein- a permease [Rhodopirellula maiorica SM1]